MKIGIIGGTGLEDPELLQDYKEKEVETPYGKPSSALVCGKIKGVEVVIIARHGKDHSIPPGNVNFRANIWALKEEGCDCILATTACGSLKQEIKPGDLVFPDQFIDFTKQRKMTFYDKNEVVHTDMAEPYDSKLRNLLFETCQNLGFDCHKDKIIISIEGPRFSTKAESHLFRQWGADIINMSSCPEVILANELGISYQNIAMSTDYDCWKNSKEGVTWDLIQQRMKQNAKKVEELLIAVLPKIANSDTEQKDEFLALSHKVQTLPSKQELYDEEFIKSKITSIKDWPKQGIVFRDITTLLADYEGMSRVIEVFYKRYRDKDIHVVVGIEARGFILGGILADKLGVGFVPIRKSGKLPRKTVSEEYELEYGTDKIEIHKDAINYGDNVLVIDDLVATGGTCVACCNLIQKLGGKVEECAFVVELEDLKGRKKLEEKGYKVFSIVKYEESG